jgi:uracil-DNA glycosylase family 4
MAAEFFLIRAYLDWQSEMGSDEVVLPQPLVKRGSAVPASTGSSATAFAAGARADADRRAATGSMATMPVPPGQAPEGALQPGYPATQGAGANPAADLYASLTQALNKTPDSRSAESGGSGVPGRGAARGPEALSLPVFADLAALWDHLESDKIAGTALVRGSGPVKAPLALVGFEPGEADLAEGLPFQGEPGVLLEKMMRAIRLDIRELYRTHLIKARIPGKVWSRRELIRPIPLLHAELGLAQAPMVLLLGQECAQAVLKTGKTLDELRQETHRMEGREFFVTYHPAELLRKEELKRKAWEDLQWLQRRMAQENGQARP